VLAGAVSFPLCWEATGELSPLGSVLAGRGMKLGDWVTLVSTRVPASTSPGFQPLMLCC